MKTRSFFLSFILISCISFAQQESVIKQEWLRTYSSQDSINNFASAIDANGNIFVTGYTINLTTGADITTIKYNAAGTQLWVKTYNGPANGRDIATGLVCDNAGNVYVTGISPGIGTGKDYVTIKYNTGGTALWTKRYNNGGSDISRDIKVDAAGNVYVTGESYGSGNYDYATIKYSSGGTQLWVKRLNNGGDDYAIDMEIDAGNNIYITGYCYKAGTGYDCATIKYNSSGIQQWMSLYNNLSTSDDRAFAIALDASANIFITGFTDKIGKDKDYLTIKYNNNGIKQWEQKFDAGNTGDVARTITSDKNNNIYVSGEVQGSNYTVITTLKYDNNGNEQWNQTYYMDGLFENLVKKIITDGNNNIYVATSSYNGSNFDYCIIKYNAGGTEQWVQTFNGVANGTDKASDITIDKQENIYITGTSFNGNNYDFATVKYSKRNIFLPIMNGDPPVSNFVYYQNKGQLKDTKDKLRSDLKYYTTNTSPVVYLTDTSLSFVFASIDTVKPQWIRCTGWI